MQFAKRLKPRKRAVEPLGLGRTRAHNPYVRDNTRKVVVHSGSIFRKVGIISAADARVGLSAIYIGHSYWLKRTWANSFNFRYIYGIHCIVFLIKLRIIQSMVKCHVGEFVTCMIRILRQ
jgi:hypothetical protein